MTIEKIVFFDKPNKEVDENMIYTTEDLLLTKGLKYFTSDNRMKHNVPENTVLQVSNKYYNFDESINYLSSI